MTHKISITITLKYNIYSISIMNGYSKVFKPWALLKTLYLPSVCVNDKF